jgi:segregation and condensation protein B
VTQGTSPTHIDLDAVESGGPVVDTLEVTAASPEGAGPGGAGPEGTGPEALTPDAAAGLEQTTLDLDAMPSGARGALEAVLMVVEEPIDEVALASALTVPVSRVRELIAELVTDYDESGRGFELRQVAGGWRIYSRADYHEVIERFVLDGQTARLTQAALETLAIVAYRQPVSRARVSAIRGVSVDAVMRTLVTRGLVEESGHDPETGAVLYRTTGYFLQRIGLASLEDLPALAPYLPEVDALDELGLGGPS